MESPTPAVRRVAVPARFRTRSTLPRIDYADAFRLALDSPAQRTAEEWARLIFDRAPGVLRVTLPMGWRALGLRREPPADDELLFGWQVRRSTPDFALLGRCSHVGMPAELVFERGRSHLLIGTLIQHRNPLTRIGWWGVEVPHRLTVRYLLSSAETY